MTLINRTFLQLIRPEIEAALADLGAKHGVAFKLGRGTYGSGSDGSFKLELARVADDGTVETKERTDYREYADIYGLKREWLDQEVELSGRTFKITGLNTKARKNMVLIQDPESGKGFVTTVRAVLAGMKYAEQFATKS